MAQLSDVKQAVELISSGGTKATLSAIQVISAVLQTDGGIELIRQTNICAAVVHCLTKKDPTLPIPVLNLIIPLSADPELAKTFANHTQLIRVLVNTLKAGIRLKKGPKGRTAVFGLDFSKPQGKVVVFSVIALSNILQTDEARGRAGTLVAKSAPHIITALTTMTLNADTEDSVEDFCGRLLINLVACSHAARLFLQEPGLQNGLPTVLRVFAPDVARALVLPAVRNACLAVALARGDETAEPWLVERMGPAGLNLPQRILPLIVPPGAKFKKSEEKLLSAKVRATALSSKPLFDFDTQKLFVDILATLVGSRPGRELLRAAGVYPVLRELEEAAESHKGLLESCHRVIGMLIGDEAPEPASRPLDLSAFK